MGSSTVSITARFRCRAVDVASTILDEGGPLHLTFKLTTLNVAARRSNLGGGCFVLNEGLGGQTVTDLFALYRFFCEPCESGTPWTSMPFKAMESPRR